MAGARDAEVAVAEPIDDDLGTDMFEEPADFRPPPPEPTAHSVSRRPANVTAGTPAEMNVRLPGHHSLWAHCLWNAGVYLAHYIDERQELVAGKTLLELGAAAALPSYVAVYGGARLALATDYPDQALIEMLSHNALLNGPDAVKDGRLQTCGYLWGADPEPLLARLPAGSSKFDVLILSDLVFNHNQHDAMLRTVASTMAADGVALVFFSSHRPWLAGKDMSFFDMARAEPFNFQVERLVEDKMPPMFPNDPGDAEIRSTVHGFQMRFSK